MWDMRLAQSLDRFWGDVRRTGNLKLIQNLRNVCEVAVAIADGRGISMDSRRSLQALIHSIKAEGARYGLVLPEALAILGNGYDTDLRIQNTARHIRAMAEAILRWRLEHEYYQEPLVANA